MRVLLLLILLLVAVQPACFGLVVGSNAAVSRMSSPVVFPASDSNNRVLGFTSLQQGLVLQDSATSVAWDALFPLDGSVILNGGTLSLNLDLAMNGQLVGNGTVSLNSRAILLNDDLMLNGLILFSSGGTLDGQGHTIDLSGTGSISAAAGSTVTIRNARLGGVSWANLVAESNATIVLQNVTLQLSGELGLGSGSLEIAEKTEVVGPYGLNVCGGILRLRSNTVCRFDQGTTLICAGTAGPNSIVFADATSRIHLDGANMKLSNDLTLTKGTLVYGGRVSIQCLAGSTLAYGDGALPMNNLSVTILQGAHVLSNQLIANDNL